MVPGVEEDILNKERPAELAAGEEDELGIGGAAKREDEVDKRVVVVDTSEVGNVTIAAAGKVWVLDGVKKVEDGVITVLGVAMGEVMLAARGELRVLDRVKVVGQVCIVLNRVVMVLDGEEGLPVEVMLEAGGNVGVLDAVMMMLAGVVMTVDGVVMVLSEEEGLPVEVVMEAGKNVGVLDAVIMMLAGVAITVDEVVIMRVGLTCEVVGFIREEGMLEDELSMDVDEED